MPTEPGLGDFLGIWDIAREVIPARGPRAGFSGRAEWCRVPGGASYVETGTLVVEGGAPMTAERRYFWGDDLSVYFDDGRLFHQVPARGGQARHFCDPDTYLVNYDFSGWPGFEVRHDVTGPRKDYVMVSRFTRPAAP